MVLGFFQKVGGFFEVGLMLYIYFVNIINFNDVQNNLFFLFLVIDFNLGNKIFILKVMQNEFVYGSYY